jgi:hypothetical protein
MKIENREYKGLIVGGFFLVCFIGMLFDPFPSFGLTHVV